MTDIKQQNYLKFLTAQRSIYNWFNVWDLEGLIGLYDKKRSGRHCKLDENEKIKVKELIKKFPKQLGKG